MSEYIYILYRYIYIYHRYGNMHGANTITRIWNFTEVRPTKKKVISDSIITVIFVFSLHTFCDSLVVSRLFLRGMRFTDSLHKNASEILEVESRKSPDILNANLPGCHNHKDEYYELRRIWATDEL